MTFMAGINGVVGRSYFPPRRPETASHITQSERSNPTFTSRALNIAKGVGSLALGAVLLPFTISGCSTERVGGTEYVDISLDTIRTAPAIIGAGINPIGETTEATYSFALPLEAGNYIAGLASGKIGFDDKGLLSYRGISDDDFALCGGTTNCGLYDDNLMRPYAFQETGSFDDGS